MYSVLLSLLLTFVFSVSAFAAREFDQHKAMDCTKALTRIVKNHFKSKGFQMKSGTKFTLQWASDEVDEKQALEVATKIMDIMVKYRNLPQLDNLIIQVRFDYNNAYHMPRFIIYEAGPNGEIKDIHAHTDGILHVPVVFARELPTNEQVTKAAAHYIKPGGKQISHVPSFGEDLLPVYVHEFFHSIFGKYLSEKVPAYRLYVTQEQLMTDMRKRAEALKAYKKRLNSKAPGRKPAPSNFFQQFTDENPGVSKRAIEDLQARPVFDSESLDAEIKKAEDFIANFKNKKNEVEKQMEAASKGDQNSFGDELTMSTSDVENSILKNEEFDFQNFDPTDVPNNYSLRMASMIMKATGGINEAFGDLGAVDYARSPSVIVNGLENFMYINSWVKKIRRNELRNFSYDWRKVVADSDATSWENYNHKIDVVNGNTGTFTEYDNYYPARMIHTEMSFVRSQLWFDYMDYGKPFSIHEKDSIDSELLIQAYLDAAVRLAKFYEENLRINPYFMYKEEGGINARVQLMMDFVKEEAEKVIEAEKARKLEEARRLVEEADKEEK